MRQRSLTQRIFTAMFGLWFSLLVAEPVQIHACPMHDGTPAQPIATAAIMVSDVLVASPGHAAAHHALQSHASSAAGHPAESNAHQCLCLGCCAGTSAIVLPSAPDINLQAPLAPLQALRVPTGEVLPVAPRFAYVRPFAIGPPEHTSAMS